MTNDLLVFLIETMYETDNYRNTNKYDPRGFFLSHNRIQSPRKNQQRKLEFFPVSCIQYSAFFLHMLPLLPPISCLLPTKTAHESSSPIFRTLPAIAQTVHPTISWYENIRPSPPAPCNHRTFFRLQIIRSIRSAGQKE